MATARLVASKYSVGSNITATSPENAYNNTDNSSSYARFQTTNNSTSDRLCYLRGFNFSAIPSNATVSAFTVKIKGYESGINTSASYAPCLVNNTTALSNTTASENFETSTKTITIPTGNLTWSTLSGYGSNFGIRFNARRNSRNSASNIYIYGAEIEVTYTAATVNVTGVSLDQNTASIEIGETLTLTETVSPSNATNKSVSWSSNNTSVATVSGGVVTAVSAGTATITVTTADGNKTDTCLVTVTTPVYKQYRQATTMEVGKSYLIANGNSGTVYLLSNEANGSRTLKGVSATVSNGVLSVTGATESKCLFECVRYTSGNDNTITVSKSNQYLYSDNSSGLRMNAPATLDRFWHYRDNKFWQFKSTTSDGYTDSSSEYKYYLSWSNGNATDDHVSTTSISDTAIPATYIFVESTGSDVAYIKENGAWVEVATIYKKVNGSWVEQTDLTQVFDSNTNYIKR